MLMRLPRRTQRVAKWTIARVSDDSAELCATDLAINCATFADTPTRHLVAIAAGFAASRLPEGERLRRAWLVVGAEDRGVEDRAVALACERLSIPATRVRRLLTGGHYPHLESAMRPEWSSHNRAEILRTIELAIDALSGAASPTAGSTHDD
jgi:hypothetical protein